MVIVSSKIIEDLEYLQFEYFASIESQFRFMLAKSVGL